MSINLKLEQLKSLKEGVVNEILNSAELNKIEKLALIRSENLWDYDRWLNDVFADWEEECAQEEERLAIADGKIPGKDYICYITDNPFTQDRDRHEVVYYDDLLSWLDEDGDSEILVATSRGDYQAKIYKSLEEVVDHIYNYAIENQSIGFEIDW